MVVSKFHDLAVQNTHGHKVKYRLFMKMIKSRSDRIKTLALVVELSSSTTTVSRHVVSDVEQIVRLVRVTSNLLRQSFTFGVV